MKNISEKTSIMDQKSDQNKLILSQVETASTTRPISENEEKKEYKKWRTLDDFNHRLQYQQQDCLDLPVTYNDGTQVNLKAFRYSPDKDLFEKPRGIVFYLHGYGSYSQDNSIYAKYLADEGFETFAMDQRGFGESGGIKFKIEKTKDIYNDYWLLIFEAIKKFDINQ